MSPPGENCEPADTPFLFLKVTTSVLCQSAVLAGFNTNNDCLRSIETKPETIKCGQQNDAANSTAAPAKAFCEPLVVMHAYLVCVAPIVQSSCGSTPGADQFITQLSNNFNDQLLLHECLSSASSAVTPAPLIKLRPKFAQCTDKQENDGALCVLELLALTDLADQLKSANLLAEVAKPASPLLDQLCTTYTTKYGGCMTPVLSKGDRCAFANPMHAMARLSLSQFCDNETRADMAANRECLNVSRVAHLLHRMPWRRQSPKRRPFRTVQTLCAASCRCSATWSRRTSRCTCVRCTT